MTKKKNWNQTNSHKEHKRFFKFLRTFVCFATLAAIRVKEQATEKEGGLARISAIEHEWMEKWFT